MNERGRYVVDWRPTLVVNVLSLPTAKTISAGCLIVGMWGLNERRRHMVNGHGCGGKGQSDQNDQGGEIHMCYDRGFIGLASS